MNRTKEILAQLMRTLIFGQMVMYNKNIKLTMTLILVGMVVYK